MHPRNAYNMWRFLVSDLAISFTGNAGPGKQENKPAGLVFISLVSKVCQFFGMREEIREKAVEAGIELIS